MPAPIDPATARLPYRLPQPAEMARDLVVAPVLPDDERIWVPQAPNVWFRPLCLSVSQAGETHTLVVPDDCEETLEVTALWSRLWRR